MGARTRRDTTRTFDTMSWQQQILMGEFNERGLRRSEEEASGEQGSCSRRVRRAAGTSNSWATGAPDALTASGTGSSEGKYLQSKDWAEVRSEAADWGTGAKKYWAEAGKSRGGASVGGLVSDEGQYGTGGGGRRQYERKQQDGRGRLQWSCETVGGEAEEEEEWK